MPTTDIDYRPLAATELERVNEIDRSEVVHQIYRVRDGALEIEDNFSDGKGWQGWGEDRKRSLRECLTNDGAAWGAFADDRLVGIAVLDGRPIGSNRDRLDLHFLHITNGYRGNGIGQELVRLVVERARQMGARNLYVSAIPSLNTITFYQRRGFALTSEIDPELYKLGPEDVHMEMGL